VQLISWTLNFRWVLWAVGGLILIVFGYSRQKKIKIDYQGIAEAHFTQILSIICGLFLLSGIAAKYFQYWTMGLHGQDFWLFVDLLEQAKKGAFFLTRFAPQGLGYVQHGTVHPMFSWAALIPFSFVLGSVHTSLLFNPVVLTLGGWMLALLAKKKWSSLSALALCGAFLFSTQVGKILMYETHPEAAYPVLLFLWLWSLGLDHPLKNRMNHMMNRMKNHKKLREDSVPVRWIPLILSILLGAGLKEDSVFVFGPWLVWGAFQLRGVQRKAIVTSFILSGFVWSLQVFAVKNWLVGNWGFSVWQNYPVVVGASAGGLQGTHWSGIQDGFQILSHLASQKGGWGSLLSEFAKFWVSKPWLSLLILAPWVLLQSQFWLIILPLSIVYSFLDGPRTLVNYYSAPFLGSFWFCSFQDFSFKWNWLGRWNWSSKWLSKNKGESTKYFALISLLAALLLGGSSAKISWPSAEAWKIKEEAQLYQHCLKRNGIVQSHLLAWVPLDVVWTDRVPRNESHWAHVDFAFFSPNLSRYEMSESDSIGMYQTLSQNPEWVRVGVDCQPLTKEEKETQRSSVVLFVKRDLP
jgi:hypothetical protein